MDPMDNGHVREFDASLASWTDERFVSAQQIRDLAMFGLYLVNLADGSGFAYRGHSFKLGSPMSTLVVKATIDDTPYVVFCSGRSYTSCVRIFLRKLEEDWLEWVPDRFG